MRLIQRLNQRAFIDKNRKRSYNHDDTMKRWVGSSFDPKDPQVDKIDVKQSKKLHR